VNRRDFLRTGVAAPLIMVAMPTTDSPYGDLAAPDVNGLMLPHGFTSRLVGESGQVVAGTNYTWHVFPDGGATFAMPDGGWVYASNSEVPGGTAGGVGAIRFDDAAQIVDAYPICLGTNTNCAGGATPWGTWLTCEEYEEGRVWECDVTGATDAIARPAMGVFRHEAVAADPERRELYLTEDDDGGRLYRFTPARWEDLTEGTLEAAREHDDGTVEWVAADSGDATTYAGGEGIAYRDGRVLFTTKSDQSIREYDVEAQRMRVVVPDGQIEGPDNIMFSGAGDLYVCEDVEQEQDLVLLAPDGAVTSVLRLGPSHADSELAGVAFDPSGTRMYLSSQRAGGGGMTFEVTGPFRQLAATTTTRPATTTTVGGSASVADDGDGDGSALPIVGGVAGVAIIGLGGLAWWRHQRGTRTT
jgi:hypothetical protein